jgi:uncharacterized membrane protein YfcA
MEGYIDIEPQAAVTLIVTGILAGLCNALAGGGTFFTFPAFLGAGLPPVVANASNAIAVWPGHAFAAVGYRKELATRRAGLGAAIAAALAGGICGALLLVVIEDDAFARLIPFLLLAATLLFAGGERLNRRLVGVAGDIDRGPALVRHGCLFVFSVYGGFFGAGLGVILMAGLLILGVTDLAENNALKNLLGAVITSVAVAIFAVSGLVSWPHTLIALAGAAVGGLLGARVAHRLSAAWLRRIVIAVGSALSVYYFFRYYV